MNPELCLGSAQFGLAYGITNYAGQVSEKTVSELLFEAHLKGIRLLDTAMSYGNAEDILGRNLGKQYSFRLISKLPAQVTSSFTSDDVEKWDKSFHASCQRLSTPFLDTFLLHSPYDLAKPGSKFLEDWLLGLRDQGLVRRLGVSIYSSRDLESINSDLLDLVQLPLSLFDQRLLDDGTIADLHARGTAIHARSVYLQGLLLLTSSQWPSWIPSEHRCHQQALELLAEQRGCQLIDLALGFARAQTYLEAVVVGVCSLDELQALTTAWVSSSPWLEREWESWAVQDSDILDPRRWPH